MQRVNVPEISFTSDSEDLADDFWFTSPSPSFDGSSVNSIPWAEDAVKQNQELWERIERMFYGEESLPVNDEKLFNEISEWRERFPYLRVIGKQQSLHFNENVVPHEQNYEEIISIHPILMYCYKRSAQTAKITGDDKYHKNANESISTNSMQLNDIEKCLRITSGPLLTRRFYNKTAPGIRPIHQTNQIPTDLNTAMTKTVPSAKSEFNKPLPKSTIASIRSSYDNRLKFANKLYQTIDTDRIQIPYSARIIQIPTIKNVGEEPNAMTSPKPNVIRIKTATLIPINRILRNSITLPSINIEPKYVDNFNSHSNANESISTLIYPNVNRSMPTLIKLPFKKRSESE